MRLWGKALCAVTLFWGLTGIVQADLNLEITGGMDVGRKIVVVPFGGQTGVNEDQNLAGIISAVNNNGIGISGIAGGNAAQGVEGVRIMSCQILADDLSVDNLERHVYF